MRKVHELGLIMNVLRLKDFYITKDGMKIVLSNLKGIGEVNHFGTVAELPDIAINLPNYFSKFATILFDPYIAPEIFFRKTLENSVYIDTWVFGCLIYELLFG